MCKLKFLCCLLALLMFEACSENSIEPVQNEGIGVLLGKNLQKFSFSECKAEKQIANEDQVQLFTLPEGRLRMIVKNLTFPCDALLSGTVENSDKECILYILGKGISANCMCHHDFTYEFSGLKNATTYKIVVKQCETNRETSDVPYHFYREIQTFSFTYMNGKAQLQVNKLLLSGKLPNGRRNLPEAL